MFFDEIYVFWSNFNKKKTDNGAAIPSEINSVKTKNLTVKKVFSFIYKELIPQVCVFSLGNIMLDLPELALISTRVASALSMRSWHDDCVLSKPLTLLSDFNSIAIMGLPSRAINNH